MKTKKSIIKNKEGLKATCSVIGIISLIVLLLYVVSLLFPLGWAIVTSFREDLDFIMNGGWAKPDPWTFYNYKLMFVGDSEALIDPTFVVPVLGNEGTRYVKIPEMIMNSLLYAIGSSVLAMLMSLLAAYVVGRFEFKFCKVVYTIAIIQMIIPVVGALPSQLEMATNLNLYDSIFGIWVMNTHVQGLYFLVFFASFKQIPKDFTEAAQIDGAGNLSIMLRIIFPFVKGSIFTVILLNFISYWNDFQTPLIFMPSHPTLAFGLYWYTTGALDASSSSTPAQLAGCIIVAIPLLALFIAFQKRLLGNITIGGLK
ncbi:MAG: carbohydrate ABC transporter permease [Clostridia bacterium]|nr:carbohydrate ABC transporter permease [Clostridia bacterium]